MGATPLKVTVSEELAKRVRARVASGQYASESELVSAALEDLEDRDRSYEERLERWLQTEAVEALDALRADPSRARSVDQVRETLRQERERITRG